MESKLHSSMNVTTQKFTTQHNEFNIDMHDLKFLSKFSPIPNA